MDEGSRVNLAARAGSSWPLRRHGLPAGAARPRAGHIMLRGKEGTWSARESRDRRDHEPDIERRLIVGTKRAILAIAADRAGGQKDQVEASF